MNSLNNLKTLSQEQKIEDYIYLNCFSFLTPNGECVARAESVFQMLDGSQTLKLSIHHNAWNFSEQ